LHVLPTLPYNGGMDRNELEHWAQQLVAGRLSVTDFVAALATPKAADLGEAVLDLDRRRRCGFPEVVFGEGKSTATLTKIFDRLLAGKIRVLATRISPDKAESLLQQFPSGRYNAAGRTFRIDVAGLSPEPRQGRVVIITAGTTDLHVAEEARETLDWMGVETLLVQDVGVAGPHRLQARLPDIQGADAVVVAAGMEAALPSVVGGYVDCPVIAVPTSVGYGASFGGVTALLGMLNSCASNVTVVNIDAGFKAGYVAGMIARRTARTSS
jgi:pyridinium-3,5-biscarboxylic acid mononucleotide synthase